MMREYLNSGMLAISAVKLAEVMNFIPAPETVAQAAIIALVTGFMGGVGRWVWRRLFERESLKKE